MEVGEVVVDVVAGASVSVCYLHSVGKISVLMTSIEPVFFFEDVLFLVEVVFLEDLISNLFF